MRAIVQRVEAAKVEVEGEVVGEIKRGIMVLVGFLETDTCKEFTYMKDKLIHLRIFEDENDKMNLSVSDVQGGILLVPNFTLYGDCKKGRRPSYILSSPSEIARKQFHEFCELMKESVDELQTGVFQTHMKVSLINDGPVTLILDT